MEEGPIAGILVILFLLIDIFLYGFGAALTHLSEKEVCRRAAEDKDAKSVRIQALIDHPERYLNTVRLVTMLVHLLTGALFVRLWSSAIRNGLARAAGSPQEPPLLLAVLAMVLTVIVILYIFQTFAVLLPKKLGARFPEQWAYACIRPMSVVIAVFTPFTSMMSLTVKGILRLVGIRDNDGGSDVTEEEIINMVQEGFEKGVIEDNEAEMISNIFAFGDKEAQDVMTHRSSVTAIDGETRLRDAVEFMLEDGSSRYPVYEENIDHIIGILYLKDALRYHRDGSRQDWYIRDLDGLLREARFVPQTKKIDELFEEMQQNKLQMVIVMDEYGQMDGLVTMEDILEEIVGSILDEYDEDTEYIEEKSADEYVVDGMTPLEELTERFGIPFEDENYETLNGFLIYRLGHIPEPGEIFETDYGGYRFRILAVDGNVIARVLVTKIPDQAETGQAETAENSTPAESALEQNGI